MNRVVAWRAVAAGSAPWRVGLAGLMLALATLAPCSVLAQAGAGANGIADAGPGTSAWLTAEGRPTAAARQAVALLADAPSPGLTATDCGADALRLALQRLAVAQAVDRHDAAQPPAPAAPPRGAGTGRSDAALSERPAPRPG